MSKYLDYEGLKKILATLRPTTKAITIPTAGWSENPAETSVYKYSLEIPITGLAAKDVVNIILDKKSVVSGSNYGIFPGTQSAAGSIKIFSKTIPKTALSGVCHVVTGNSGEVPAMGFINVTDRKDAVVEIVTEEETQALKSDDVLLALTEALKTLSGETSGNDDISPQADISEILNNYLDKQIQTYE